MNAFASTLTSIDKHVCRNLGAVLAIQKFRIMLQWRWSSQENLKVAIANCLIKGDWADGVYAWSDVAAK